MPVILTRLRPSIELRRQDKGGAVPGH
jgi:hypothetical protein